MHLREIFVNGVVVQCEEKGARNAHMRNDERFNDSKTPLVGFLNLLILVETVDAVGPPSCNQASSAPTAGVSLPPKELKRGT